MNPTSIRSDWLDMDYFLVPWDTEIFGFNVAQIEHIEVRNSTFAQAEYSGFEKWCTKQNVMICSCRIRQSQLEEAVFLQNHRFQFIELNYRPVFRNLMSSNIETSDESVVELSIQKASAEDRGCLVNMARTVFHHGRFHQDISVETNLANHRYAIWMKNSFSQPDQTVYKCVRENKIVAFFVVKYEKPKTCHWSLIGLAPNLSGAGLGYQVWSSMMKFHQREGIDTITTSISSHNTAVFNLYVKLGFRFPSPAVTFHWRPC